MTTVFICIPWFHPAFRAGGPVQSIANLVNEFNADIRYRIFCADTDLNGISLEHIETAKWVRYNSNTEVWYAPRGNRARALKEEVGKVRPDVLYIIGLYSWHFNIVPLLFCKAPRKIISARGMLHPGALSQKRIKKVFYLKLFKALGLHKKINFHATDDIEKKYIKDIMGFGATVFVAGNFPHKLFKGSRVVKAVQQLRLISVALIGPMKNHLLVLQALEQCRSTVEYHICGPVKDAAYWQLCLQQIKRLGSNIRICCHGEVRPDMVQEMIGKADVFILPSKSENFGHAFYEALSAGKPVITSNNTPWQHLKEKYAGINVLTEPKDIGDAIAFFSAMAQDEYDRWSEGALAYALMSVDIEHIKQQYKEMFILKRTS